MSEQIHIAAAGYGTRLQPHIQQLGYPVGYPKHLLPTGAADGETFLGRIIRQALPIASPQPITVHVNQENQPHIAAHSDIPRRVRYDTRQYNHSLDMFFEQLLVSGERVVGCAGDYYAAEDLTALIAHHDASKFPVTALAGYSVAVDSGISYGVNNDNKVTTMQRADRTKSSDPLNIGAYIFEPDPIVMRVIHTYRPTASRAPTDDRIFEAFVRHGLLGAYVTNGPTYNVNTPHTYEAVLQHTQTFDKQVISA